jgi:predicted GNAT family N-acyltransferase
MCNLTYMDKDTRVSATSFEYEIAPVVTAEQREAVFAIRMLVFVEEQAVPPEEELDVYDLTADHFMARLRSTAPDDPAGIVATARLVDKGAGLGKIGRVAVLKEHRGKGVGAALMRSVEAAARAQSFAELILEAQVYAIPFYEKLGYAAEGEVFDDCGIDHRLMRKTILAAS